MRGLMEPILEIYVYKEKRYRCHWVNRHVLSLCLDDDFMNGLMCELNLSCIGERGFNKVILKTPDTYELLSEEIRDWIEGCCLPYKRENWTIEEEDKENTNDKRINHPTRTLP